MNWEREWAYICDNLSREYKWTAQERDNVFNQGKKYFTRVIDEASDDAFDKGHDKGYELAKKVNGR